MSYCLSPDSLFAAIHIHCILGYQGRKLILDKMKSLGFDPPREWGGGGGNSGNLPYLIANTYGLNFIKIGGI